MPFADDLGCIDAPPAMLDAFRDLCGGEAWRQRLSLLEAQAQPRSLAARAAQQRHALELAIGRLGKDGSAEGRAAGFVRSVLRLAAALPPAGQARLRQHLQAALQGDATLMPLFHLLRCAARHHAQGFSVRFEGLAEAAPHDLLLRREGQQAVLACETVSAEEGRPVHRGDWFTLVDRVNPELQTWLAAHPGRYLLKMTLPEGLVDAGQLGQLHLRISALLQSQKREDSSADAVLKLDPLVLAGAQAAGTLPARLRAAFGPDAHLAVTTGAGDGSVFVMAARAAQESAIAAAVARRMSAAAAARLADARAGILAIFLEDVERQEWQALRQEMTLEGAARRFLTAPEARPVVAVSCASRLELFGAAEGAPEGELRFRNPGHPAAKLPALAPAISSSV